jgi:hypothetical protein
MKNAVFWDVAPCSSCVNRGIGGTYRLNLQARKLRERGTSGSRFTQELHDTTSQKKEFFKVTAVKTSNHQQIIG